MTELPILCANCPKIVPFAETVKYGEMRLCLECGELVKLDPNVEYGAEGKLPLDAFDKLPVSAGEKVEER